MSKKEKYRKEFTNEDAANKYEKELKRKGFKTYNRSCYDVYRQEMTYAVGIEKRVCDDTCDNCIYIGEGDFICDRKSELVIEDWFPVFGYCLLDDSILSEGKNA